MPVVSEGSRIRLSKVCPRRCSLQGRIRFSFGQLQVPVRKEGISRIAICKPKLYPDENVIPLNTSAGEANIASDKDNEFAGLCSLDRCSCLTPFPSV